MDNTRISRNFDAVCNLPQLDIRCQPPQSWLMVDAQELQNKLAAALPGATVIVANPYNDGTHLTAEVTSPAFNGLSRLQQHRMVYAALGDAFANELHALQLTTRTA